MNSGIADSALSVDSYCGGYPSVKQWSIQGRKWAVMGQIGLTCINWLLYRMEGDPETEIILASKALKSQQLAPLLSRHDNTVVTRIALQTNLFDSEAIFALNSHNWTALLELNLGQNRLNNRSLKLISNLQSPLLRRLMLYENHFDSAGIIHLSKASFRNLTVIDLGNCNIKDEVVGHLSRTTWRRLERLDLGNMSAEGLNKISRLGMCELVKGEFPELFTLYLYRNRTRQEEGQLLRRVMRDKFRKLANLWV